MIPFNLSPKVLIALSLFTPSAMAYDMSVPVQVPINIFTKENFKSLCRLPGSENTAAFVNPKVASVLLLNAAKVNYSKLLSEAVASASEDGDLGAFALAETEETTASKFTRYLLNQAKNLDLSETAATAKIYLESNPRVGIQQALADATSREGSEKSVINRIADLIDDLEKIKKLPASKAETRKYLEIAISFHLWSLSEGMKPGFPYDNLVLESGGEAPDEARLVDFLISNTSIAVLDAFLSAKEGDQAYLKAGCRQPWLEKTGLMSNFRIRKSAAHLRHNITSSKAAGAELMFTRNETEEIDPESLERTEQVVNKLAFEGTIGFNPFSEHSDFFMYTSFTYKDDDIKINGINESNQAACKAAGKLNPEDPDDCGIDTDERRTLKVGFTGSLPILNIDRFPIRTDVSYLMDDAFSSEQTVIMLGYDFFDNKSASVLGKGARIGRDSLFSLQPRLWGQGAYIIDVGSNEALQALDLTDEDGDGGYFGFASGLGAMFQWRALQLEAAYERLFIVTGDVSDTDRYTASVSYQFPSLRNTALMLSYEKGNKLDSFNQVDEFALKVTFKY